MQLTQKQIVIAAGIGVLVLIFTLMLLGIIPGIKNPDGGPVTKGVLSVWVIGDDFRTYDAVAQEFYKKYPEVNVEYQTFGNDEAFYENNLINALAAGRGPDIFMVRNNNIAKYVNKTVPAPSSIINSGTIRSLFPNTVTLDFVLNDAVFGIPFSLDSLALIYNRDLFNEAGVVFPPTTWEEFTDTAKKLTVYGTGKQIVRSGAAFGGANNITNAPDIISLLMLQAGTTMVDKKYSQSLFNSKQGLVLYSFS